LFLKTKAAPTDRKKNGIQHAATMLAKEEQ